MVLLTLAVMWPNLTSNAIDDLDSAHHLMDGYFFRDLVVDHPLHGLTHYPLTYYKQYPALGFLFWPPLIPAVYGVFCLVGGAHIQVVRICMFCFGLTFCLSFYALLRRQVSVALSVIGVVVVTTAPGMVWSFNQVMLEMPTVALMFLSMLAYFNFVEKLGTSGSYKRAVLCGIMSGLLIYSKQPAWFLLCAFLADYFIRRRGYTRSKEALVAAAVAIGLDVPLVIFTLTLGRANLGQSLGSSTNRIMQQYHALPRWSLAAWTYYPSLALSKLDFIIVLAVIAGVLLALTHKAFLRANVIWFSWFVLAYVTFSYYDNRSPRHATFWWPSWVAIAVLFVGYVQQHMPRRVQWVLPALLLVPVPLQLMAEWKTQYSDYTGVQQPITQLFAAGDPGTVLMFGSDKQALIAVIREQDTHRVVHIIRGERLLEAKRNVADICHDFRINTVLVEVGAGQPNVDVATSGDSVLHEVLHSEFSRRGEPITLVAYHYTGPMSPTAQSVSLSNALTE